jgi:hypothetical protein
VIPQITNISEWDDRGLLLLRMTRGKFPTFENT